jgi:hypothetical protein
MYCLVLINLLNQSIMKRFLTFVLLFAFTTSFSQTLVNQSVLDTLPAPVSVYQYLRVVPDSAGGLVIVSDYYPTDSFGQGNIVAGLDASHNFIGSFDFTFLNGGINVGSNVCTKGNYAYVVSATADSAFNTSTRCNLLKLNISTMDTVWTVSKVIDSAVQQAPFSVLVDSLGNVYMGASVQTATDYKIAVIKYDQNGNEIWEGSYDTVGLYTLPIAMALSGSGTALAVTGFSFDGLGNSNFVTADFTTSSGHMYGYKTSANGTGAISHPIGITTDNVSNTYIAGTSTVSGTSSVIKLIKYDSAFNQIWVRTWGDSSAHNTATSLAMDQPHPDGNLLVTGTSPNASGGTDMVTQEYSASTGTLVWSKRLSAPNPAYAMSGIGVTNDGNGSTYVTGSVYNGRDTDIVSVAYDTSGNLLWTKTYGRSSGSTDVPFSIVLNNNNTPIVTARSSNSTNSIYLLLENDQWSPTPCKTISDTTPCPTITYVFENGKLDTIGTDTFVEFDIYAKQNTPSLGYAGGEIIFTYSNSIFGTDVVDSGNITVTRGAITADTNAYSIAINDTLFKSDALPPNGGEVNLLIAAIDTPLFAIADSLQQLCHIKMKLKHEGNFQINFDQFFMENQSVYYTTDIPYTYVYTGRFMSLRATSSSVSLIQTLTDFSYDNVSTITMNLRVYTSPTPAVLLASVDAGISWDNSIASYTNTITPNWAAPNYYNEQLNQSGGSLDYDIYQPGGEAPSTYSFTTSSIDGGEIFLTISLNYLPCSGNPGIIITLPAVGSASYYDATGAPQNFQIAASGSHGPYCIGGINNINDISIINVYPDPFANSFILNFNLVKNSNVTVEIDDLIGRDIYQNSLGNLEVGEYNKEMSIPSSMTDGVYILKVKTDDFLVSKKIIKR